MKGNFIGRIVGWQDLYQLAECNYAPVEEESHALRNRWGVVEFFDDSTFVPVLHVKDIHNGEEGIIFPFEVHTVMPAMYND